MSLRLNVADCELNLISRPLLHAEKGSSETIPLTTNAIPRVERILDSRRDHIALTGGET